MGVANWESVTTSPGLVSKIRRILPINWWVWPPGTPIIYPSWSGSLTLGGAANWDTRKPPITTTIPLLYSTKLIAAQYFDSWMGFREQLAVHEAYTCSYSQIHENHAPEICTPGSMVGREPSKLNKLIIINHQYAPQTCTPSCTLPTAGLQEHQLQWVFSIQYSTVVLQHRVPTCST